MIRKILVPLDGSPFGESALPHALEIARRTHAELELVHVHLYHEPDTDVEGITPYHFEDVLAHDHEFDQSAFAKDEARLEELAAGLNAAQGVSARGRVLRGSVAPTLFREAEALRADLVVMATHGRGGISRSWLGSVADYLVRHATMPLLLVRPEIDPEQGRALRSLMVPLDGSAFSEQVLGPAVELIGSGRIILLRVLTPLLRYGVPPADFDAPEIQEERARAEDYLEMVASQLSRGGVDADTLVVRHPQPAAAIIEEAQLRDVDAVAMATHGRGGMVRLLIGSTADKVIRGGHTPVLVFRPAAAPERPRSQGAGAGSAVS